MEESSQEIIEKEIDFLNEIVDELILKVNEMVPLTKRKYKMLHKQLKTVLDNVEFMA